MLPANRGTTIWSRLQLMRLFLRVLLSWLLESNVFAAEPSFRVPELSVSVIEGETAVLPCSIQYLGGHQVVWTDSDGFLLTHNDRRIIEDNRLSVERPFTKDWNLHIRNVMLSDKGKYVCQINTTPVKTKHIQLDVLVPPVISEDFSSSDCVVREGETVSLVCNATGVPQPTISWYRLYTTHTQEKERIGSVGHILKIHNVSRDCGGTYICEAENGIEPKQKRQMMVYVEFSPEVYLPSSRIGQYPGKETFLQCEVTAHPHGIMYWAKGGKVIDQSNQNRPGKYSVEMFSSDYDEKKILSLRIREIEEDDYGKYMCVAKNIVGEDKQSMILYDYSIHLKKSTTTEEALVLPPPYADTTLSEDDKSVKPTDTNMQTQERRRYGVNNHGRGDNMSAVRSSSSTLLMTNTVVSVISMVHVIKRLMHVL